jgi:hypothetical protein
MKFLMFLFLPTFLLAQNDCQTAPIICENSTIVGNSAGFSIQELNSSNRGCILSNERQSSWYVLNIAVGGSFTFQINPTNGTDDYDFAIWNYTCPVVGSPIRCSFAAGGGVTGLNFTANDLSENSLGNRFVRFMNVNDGDTYLLLVNNFTSSFSPFDLNFGGTAQLGCFLLSNNISINGFENGNKNLITMYSDKVENYKIEYSNDCVSWHYLANVNSIDFICDHKAESLVTYYRANNDVNISNVIAVKNKNFQNLKIEKYFDIIGREVSNDFEGLKIVKFSNGTYKIIK